MKAGYRVFICILITAIALILSVFFVLLLYNPLKFDYVFAHQNPHIIEVESKFSSILFESRKLNLKNEFPESQKICIVDRGVNPVNQIELLGISRNQNILSNLGPLFMGSDRDWHIIVINKGNIIIYAINGFIFPISPIIKCDSSIIINYDEISKNFVVEGA